MFDVKNCPGPNPGGAQTQCAIQVYRALQYEADRQIGRLLDWLDDNKLRENTLFTFSTDNGPEDPHVDMHAVGDPGPFRGRKRSLYEGGVRVRGARLLGTRSLGTRVHLTAPPHPHPPTRLFHPPPQIDSPPPPTPSFCFNRCRLLSHGQAKSHKPRSRTPATS
jgi:hypothetical protein